MLEVRFTVDLATQLIHSTRSGLIRMSDPPEPLRSALSDRYRLGREVGSGGMGHVYLAEDIKHHREVAIKVLRPGLDEGAGGARFLREIEIASGLSHPHLVPLYDSGVAEGLLYYVMPYVEGESLKALIKKHGRLDAERALSIAADVADGLGFAHDHGFIHRDIKPGNILLAGRNALIADFGVARALEVAGTKSLTASDASIGTLYYMSPEQFSDTRAVDARSDIYSLGCVVYEMLSGRPPFNARSAAAVIAGHVQGDVPTLADADIEAAPEVEALVARMLAKEPEDRFQSADEVAEALSPGHTVPSIVRSAPRAGTRRLFVGLAAAALAAAVVVVSSTQRGTTLRVDGGDESVVVLPYASPTASPEEIALVVDMADELTLQLNRWESVRAVPQIALSGVSFDLGRRASTFETIPQGLDVAKSVGVRTLVTVSLRLRGDTALVTSSLYDADSGRSQGRPFESIGALDDPYRLANGVVHGMLGLEGDVDDIEELRRQSAFPEALRQQARGRDMLAAWRVQEAESAFRVAIAIDSTFAMAHHYLALSLYWQTSRDPSGLASLGPEIGQRSLAAIRHSAGTPTRDSIHIAAFNRFQEGDYEAARATYNELIRRDSTDVYGWLLLGAVEYLDPWLVERSDGSFTPRKSLNVALDAFREAVRLSPGFHLGYGHLFDITRDVLGPLEGGGSSGFEMPREEPLRPWERDVDPYTLIAFSPILRDTLEWVRREEYLQMDRALMLPGAEGLLRASMRTLQRWSEFAPEEWRPHEELAAWTIRERALLPIPSAPELLDSLAARALQHTTRALTLKPDTLALELLTLGNLQLATGDLEAAQLSIDAAEALRTRDAPSARRRRASNLALFTGRPRGALAVVDGERPSRLFFVNPASPDQLIDDGGVQPTIQRLRILGATGSRGPELAAAFARLVNTWSRERYSEEELLILKANVAPRIALALSLDPTQASWASVEPSSEDPIWDVIVVREEDASSLRENVLRAASHDDVAVGGAARAYILGAAAQRAGMHREALTYLARLDSIPHSVTARDPGWGLLARSFLLRGRSLEALGQNDPAGEMYGRFLEAWSDPDDLAPPLGDEAAESLQRIAGGG